MRKLFASAAVVAMAAIGISVATAATASAAAPSTGALDKAWVQTCTSFVPNPQYEIDHGTASDAYFCWDGASNVQEPSAPPLQGLCDAMGGTYTNLYDVVLGRYLQECVVYHS